MTIAHRLAKNCISDIMGALSQGGSGPISVIRALGHKADIGSFHLYFSLMTFPSSRARGFASYYTLLRKLPISLGGHLLGQPGTNFNSVIRTPVAISLLGDIIFIIITFATTFGFSRISWRRCVTKTDSATLRVAMKPVYFPWLRVRAVYLAVPWYASCQGKMSKVGRPATPALRDHWVGCIVR